MLSYFKEKRSLIAKELQKHLQSAADEYSSINRWGNESIRRLLRFSENGKMIRGGLVLLGHELYDGDSQQAAMDCATAMELFQSAFLVHDDIMDRDLSRRGNPSFFSQYKAMADEQELKDSYHFGESMGICAGDIAFFLGFRILSALDIDPTLRAHLIAYASTEYAKVGLAQMEDVYFGHITNQITRQEVLKVYHYKTARYTFSLPLSIGAILSRQSEEMLELLIKFGEALGVIFQIKDDELGLFEDESDTGKPVGSDIKEGKQTLLTVLITEKSKGAELVKFKEILGNPDATLDDIKFVRELAEKSGAREESLALVQKLAVEARKILDSLNLKSEHKQILEELIAYSVGRKA